MLAPAIIIIPASLASDLESVHLSNKHLIFVCLARGLFVGVNGRRFVDLNPYCKMLP